MACCDWLCVSCLLRQVSRLTFALQFCSSLSTVMNIYNLYRRQHQLSEIMSSNSGMSRWFYIRLMIICVVETLATIPLGSWVMATVVKAGLRPWVSWANVHSDYSYIQKIPSTEWRRNWAHSPDVYRWLVVLCAFAFFALFGFADEARQNYCRMYRWLVSLFGYSTMSNIFSGRSHAYVDQSAGFECWAHIFPVLLHLTWRAKLVVSFPPW